MYHGDGWIFYVSADTAMKYIDSPEFPKGSMPQQEKPEMPV
jgi:hypothetical protein